MMKLDRYGDNYMDLYVPAMFEEVGMNESLLHSPIIQRDPAGFTAGSNLIDDQTPPLNVNPFLTSTIYSNMKTDNGL